MNFRYFPYDKQQCNLKFGSWLYLGATVNMTIMPSATNDTADLRWYQYANDFKLISTKGVRGTQELACCPGYEWVDITYTINMKRVSSAYSVKLVLPAVLTGFLILATFLLPPASYEKITLSGLIFIALLLQLIYLHDIVPASGDTILGEYLGFALFIDFFAVIFAVVSYNITDTRMKEPGPADLSEQAQIEGSLNDLKRLVPKGFRKEWLRHWDVVGFAVFSIVFIIGLAIVLGRRG
ncbi:acetylcholine receptor subunit alpha-type unc-38-like [Amphiura filiformis]|uniref:acetylcholine receptor subunit alpha-type unc-38-like n=1 Tax=Amphiura filiformis TaxID=82378 RepID=UPI003B21EDDD